MPLLSPFAYHQAGLSSPISMSEEEAGKGPLEQRSGEGKAEEVDPASAPPHPPSLAIISPQVKTRQEAVSVAAISSRVVSLFTGDAAGAAAEAFEKWVALVRKRSGTYRCSGFPNRPPKLDPRMPWGIFRSFSYSSSESSSSSDGVDCHQLRLYSHQDICYSSEGGTDCSSINLSPSGQVPETSLWERLGQAVQLDIDSSDFSWDTLSSLHHTEHTCCTEQSEDEMNKALEVTVNSGGVVFFGLFNSPEDNSTLSKEAAAVIKIASSRMATQSERLGYEFAKWLRVQTPQGRAIHISSPEWQRIKDAADKAREMAIAMHDDVGEMTCAELVEALELSRCLFLMNYVHGSPLLESQYAFGSQEAAKRTSAALGRVLMLDLILRNEDRLPCRQLGWRGNSANLLFADKSIPTSLNVLEDSCDPIRYCPSVIKSLQKERRACSFDTKVPQQAPAVISQSFNELDDDKSSSNLRIPATEEIVRCDFQIVAIDSGVPRRPPAGKRLKDQTQYPKVVELLLNNAKYASDLLCEISGGRLGLLTSDDDDASQVNSSSCLSESDMMEVVNEFRGGFRAALRDLQGFHLFLLTLNQKLDGLLHVFLSIIDKTFMETDKEDLGSTEIQGRTSGFGFNTPPPCKEEQSTIEGNGETSDSEQKRTIPKPSSSGARENSDSASFASRDNWHARCFRGSGEPRSIRLTMKLRDFQKFAKVDADLNNEIEQWNEMFRTDVIRLCQENNFNTGFFEGGDTNMVVDAYELKVRLDHILERISLISDAANTERPSLITTSMFIGGALAARSVHTLQHLGISHILCLCSNEIGQSDSQFPELFEYKNFSISDNDDADIRNLFEEAFNFIDYVEKKHGMVLVHCFEGRSRSATVILAYLMLRKNFNLSKAWNLLKKAHRRAQPNDGFAKVLVEIDENCHGMASMEWQHRRPMMKVCPVCGKNAGLSSSSLKLHLQKAHRRISSGSVDSALALEIQKALDALKVSRGGSVSPTLRQQQQQFLPTHLTSGTSMK